MNPSKTTVAVKAIRPLVRYVDKEVAVIDLQLAFEDYCKSKAERRKRQSRLQVLLHMQGPAGRVINLRTALDINHRKGTARFEIDRPRMWWPAGMGDQSLYSVNVKTLSNSRMIDNRDISLGLTSVRTGMAAHNNQDLLVNGQPCRIRTIIPVTPADKAELIRADGDSMLLVHDHFGPEVLYNAADRAGLLMLQSIPVPPDEVVRCGATKVFNVDQQVDRLTAHPSLAGWFVGQIGHIADHVAMRIHALDPTRVVFRHIPVN